MCSTFKLLASAAVLKRVDEGKESLDLTIAYGAADLLEYAPVTKAHAGDGGMRLGDLCAAAIDWSDNTAANLILSVIGGPNGFTQFARSLGDEKTRLDRNEPSLNTAIPGDPRDTTTPLAMARDIEAVLIGERSHRGVAPATRGLADRRQGRRQAAARRPAAILGDRRQDRQRRSRHGEHDRRSPAARPRPAPRRGLFDRVRRPDGRPQRRPQGDRRDHRGDVLRKVNAREA